MKKILLIGSLLFASFLGAEEVKGFLTTKYCADKGLFADCRTETAMCGYDGCHKDWNFGDKPKIEYVLFIHNKPMYYKLELDGVKLAALDSGFARNDVTIIGEVDHDKKVIKAKDMKAPPPPGKSFFKGCL